MRIGSEECVTANEVFPVKAGNRIGLQTVITRDSGRPLGNNMPKRAVGNVIWNFSNGNYERCQYPHSYLPDTSTAEVGIIGTTPPR
jgi:hypothetical protein